MTTGKMPRRGNQGLPDNFTFDGVQLGPSTNYVKLVREQLKDGSVWPSGDASTHQGVRRVIDAAEGTAAEGSLFDALLTLVSDDDAAVRTSAIRLAWDYADKVDTSKLLKALTDRPAMYEGVKPVGVTESYMPDLYWGLIQAMSASPKSSREVIDTLRRAAEDPRNGFRVLGGLARKDSGWVIANAHRLLSEQPVRARIVLANLTTPQLREQFVRALASEPMPFREELARVIEEKIKSASERQRLRDLLA